MSEPRIVQSQSGSEYTRSQEPDELVNLITALQRKGLRRVLLPEDPQTLRPGEYAVRRSESDNQFDGYGVMNETRCVEWTVYWLEKE
jgi:hypothetical protein